MFEPLMEAAEAAFPRKAFLTIDDVCEFLACSRPIVYNWIKRSDPSKRPPRLLIGNEPRFPKRPFIEWLAKEQVAKGGHPA